MPTSRLWLEDVGETLWCLESVLLPFIELAHSLQRLLFFLIFFASDDESRNSACDEP